MSLQFLGNDGFINVESFKEFNQEVVKFVDEQIKEDPKNARVHKLIGIHFSPKAIAKFDAVKAKKEDLMYTRKRGVPIKVRTRAPKDGARVKMVVIFREFANMPADFAKDQKAAMAAIAAHNKKAERLLESVKKQRVKDKEVKGKAFDKTIAEVTDLLTKAGMPEKNIVIGVSMMGKTLLAKLKSGQVISIGLADQARFEKARDTDPDAPVVSPLARARANKAGGSDAAPAGRRTKAAKEEAPVATGRRPRATKEVAPATTGRRTPAAKAPAKPIGKRTAR